MAGSTNVKNGICRSKLTSMQGVGSCGGNYCSYSNFLSFPPSVDDVSSMTYRYGRGLGVRAEYMSALTSNQYPSAPWSLPVYSPRVLGQNWNYKNCLTQGYDKTRPYRVAIDLPPDRKEGDVTIPQNYPYRCRSVGYTNPITSAFATGTGQPVISATIPQVCMVEGRILEAPIPKPRKTFRIPLISAILGVLIPPDQYQLIPAASVKDIILQITLNPYAFFTTGYCDVHQFDQIGMQNMQPRQWKILNLQWVWHLYNFTSQDINADIQAKLYNGITISTNYWQLAAQYQLPNGSYVRNSFQIPVNVASLAEVLTAFISNQYQTKTFCRKNMRLCNNILTMQIKANGAWYPLQPISGNAGNPQDDGTSGDNWNFYEPLLLSNNFLFNTNVPLPRINVFNFAVNGRIYDTNRKGTLLPPQLYNMPKQDYYQVMNSLSSPKWGEMNTQTAFGYANFHQNRYVGRAMFSYTWEPYGHSKDYVHGLDTTGYRQFDIIFNNSPREVYPDDQTMLIFARSNAIVVYKDGVIQVMGAA